MKRHLLKILGGLSLLLCMATVTLWVRSYWHTDELEHGLYDDTVYDYWFFASTRGRMTLEHRFIYGDGDEPPTFAYFSRQPYLSTDDLPWLGYAWKAGDNSRSQICFAGMGWERQSETPMDPQDYRSLALSVPDWSIVSITLGIAAAVGRHHFRERRATRRGLCAACGYDMRATSDRCPECGTVPRGK